MPESGEFRPPLCRAAGTSLAVHALEFAYGTEGFIRGVGIMDVSSNGMRAAGLAAWIVIGGTPIAATAAPWTLSPAGLGMGGAYTAVARDVDAALVNPANLALDGNHACAVKLVGMTAQAGYAGLNLTDLRHFVDSDLNDEQKAALVASLKGDEVAVDADGNLESIGVSMHGFAITTGTLALVDARAPRDLVELLLDENELGRTYNFAGTGGSSAILSTITGSGARKLKVGSLAELSVGAAFHYYKGWQYNEVESASGSVTLDITDLDTSGEIVTRSAQDGTGFGIDLGVAGRRGEHLAFGVVLQNLGGKVRWHNAERSTLNFNADSLTVQQILNGEDVVEALEDTEPTPDFDTTLPASARLGVAVKGGPLLIATDLVADLVGEKFSAPTRVHLGSEVTVWKKFPLRGGMAFGPSSKPRFSLGFGAKLGILRIDVAGVSEGSLHPDQAGTYGGALGFGLVF